MIRLFYDNRSCGLNTNLLKSAVEVLDNEYIIYLEAAGFKKEDFKITLEDNVLTVEVKRDKEEGKEYFLDERFYGKLYRSFTLKDLKDEDVKATYVDGILTIRVPKLSEAETKKIITVE